MANIVQLSRRIVDVLLKPFIFVEEYEMFRIWNV